MPGRARTGVQLLHALVVPAALARQLTRGRAVAALVRGRRGVEQAVAHLRVLHGLLAQVRVLLRHGRAGVHPQTGVRRRAAPHVPARPLGARPGGSRRSRGRGGGGGGGSCRGRVIVRPRVLGPEAGQRRGGIAVGREQRAEHEVRRHPRHGVPEPRNAAQEGK